MRTPSSVVLGLLAASCIGVGSASAVTYFQENFDNQSISGSGGSITLNAPQVGYAFTSIHSQGNPFSLTSWSPSGNKAIKLIRTASVSPSLQMYGINGGMVSSNTVEFSFDSNHDYIHRFNAPIQVTMGMGPDYQNQNSAGPGQLLFIGNNDPNNGSYFYTDQNGNMVSTGVLPTERGWDHIRVDLTLQKQSFGGSGYGFDYMTGTFNEYIRSNGLPEQQVASNVPLGYGIIPDDNPATVGYNEQTDVFWYISKGVQSGDNYYDNVYSGSPTTPPTNAGWAVNNSGSWSVAGNWTPGIPNTAGTVANFGSIITAPRTVTVDSSQTTAMLIFNNANKYTIAGSATLTLDNATDAVGAYVTAGSHDITAPLSLMRETTFTVNPSTSTLTITNLLPSTVGIIKSGLGTLVVNNLRAGSLSMDGGLDTGTTTVGAGALVIAPGRSTAHTSNVGSLGPFPASGTGAFLATLDLNDNDMVVNSGSATLATIRSLIVSGYNAGSWNSTGITSTAARLNNTTPGNKIVALGYADNGLLGYTTFSGQSVGANSILIRYTLAGDADVTGTVDTVDFNLLASNFSQSGKVWLNGDFDYNGTVDTVDFNLLAANFSQSLPASTISSSLVPEPASMGALAMAMCSAGRRRRRNSKRSLC